MTARCPAPDADGRWCEYVGGGPCIRCGRRISIGVDADTAGNVSATVIALPPGGAVMEVIGHSRWSRDDMIAAVLRGQERATADVQQGVADLEQQLATADEWDASAPVGDAARHITPKRQILAGMLRHLRRHQGASS